MNPSRNKPSVDGEADLNAITQAGDDTVSEAELGPVSNPAAPKESQENLKAEVSELRQLVKKLLEQPSASTKAPSKDTGLAPDLADMMRIILRREERIAMAEEGVLNARAKKAQQLAKNLASSKNDDLLPQINCRHLKGGKTRRKGQRPDPSVYRHRFVDGTVRIKCTICGMFWGPKDTETTLFRRGSSIKNHTGISWRQAIEMVNESTNKDSSSEIPGTLIQSIGEREGRV